MLDEWQRPETNTHERGTIARRPRDPSLRSGQAPQLAFGMALLVGMLEGVFISRDMSGVVGVLRRSQVHLFKCDGALLAKDDLQ